MQHWCECLAWHLLSDSPLSIYCFAFKKRERERVRRNLSNNAPKVNIVFGRSESTAPFPQTSEMSAQYLRDVTEYV